MARQSFGKYEVLARLATGGAASIFLARQPGAAGFNKLVCLKTLLPERASDADFVRMFLDEARLAARLHHPNCVQIYDLGRVDNVYYISMEYIFGETLWNLLTTVTRLKTPLPPAHVAAIVANVCDGLHHAHELKDKSGKAFNLVHRDVSPQNVMVGFEGQTKVVDFGIAKAETDRPPTVAGIVKGKFSYMSPEQITGNPVDRRSDIYSLGIVMFECLASRRLYRGDTPEEIARLILEHRAPRLRDVVPDIPEALDDICARALSRQPTRRFQSALAMAMAIREYLDSIRFNGNANAIARLMEDRFGEVVARRRDAYESALTGDYDESSLFEAMGAKPVRRIDLFSDDAGPVLLPDAVHDEPPTRPVTPSGVIRTLPDPASQPASRSRREGPGWQLELQDHEAAAQSVSVRPVADLTLAEESMDSDRTRLMSEEVEPVVDEAANGGQTRVDPGVPDHDDSPWAGLRSAVDVSAELSTTGPFAIEESSDPFRDSTPFDEMAQALAEHPDPALAPSRRLSHVEESPELSTTVYDMDDETADMTAAFDAGSSAEVIPLREQDPRGGGTPIVSSRILPSVTDMPASSKVVVSRAPSLPRADRRRMASRMDAAPSVVGVRVDDAMRARTPTKPVPAFAPKARSTSRSASSAGVVGLGPLAAGPRGAAARSFISEPIHDSSTRAGSTGGSPNAAAEAVSGGRYSLVVVLIVGFIALSAGIAAGVAVTGMWLAGAATVPSHAPAPGPPVPSGSQAPVSPSAPPDSQVPAGSPAAASPPADGPSKAQDPMP